MYYVLFVVATGVAPIVYVGFVLGLCFVAWFLVSFHVYQSYCGGREIHVRASCFSRCHEFCILWLWHFLLRFGLTLALHIPTQWIIHTNVEAVNLSLTK